ncbi:MAG: FecR domain-containing protein [Salinivirgaceae bacterium]
MDSNNEHISPMERLIRFFASESTEAECAQIEEWRSASAKNQMEFDAIAKLWELSGQSVNNAAIDLDREWKRMERTISLSQPRTISLNRILQIAASIIILIGASWFFYNQSQKVATKTATAQVQTIILPDGSKVTLNALSNITYSKKFGEQDRKLTLKGEAFFDVAKNAHIPFIIDAQGASIQVVGTQFNVKAYKQNQQVKVTVVEGTVQLFETKEPAKKMMLTAGETGVYHKDQKAIIKNATTDLNDISWKTKHLEFENSTLLEVVEVLSNTYHVTFEVSDAVKNCTITVDFDQKDLASILKVLKSTLDLRISKLDGKIIISGDGC